MSWSLTHSSTTLRAVPLPRWGRICGVVLVGLALSACAGGVGNGRNGGLATYDDLKVAQQKCAAQGGHLKLQRNGDVKYLDDYACEKK